MAGYLELRHRTYMVFLDIPKDVRSHFGRQPGSSGGKRFAKSLETGNRAVAEARRVPIVSRWKAQIEAARKGTLDPVEQDIIYWRKALDLASDSEANTEGVIDQLQDYAEKLERKRSGDGVKLYKVTMGQWVRTTDHLDDWLATTRDTKKTKDMKRSDVKRFAKKFPMVQEVTRAETRRWADKLVVDEGLSRKTVARVLSALRGYWRYLRALEVVSEESLPFDHLDLAAETEQRKKRLAFKPAEVRAFLDIAEASQDDSLADLIRLGMWSGARIEELCSLRLENVEGDLFRIEDAKTPAGWREVPVHPSLKATLKRLTKDSEDGYVLPGLTPDKYGDRSSAIGKRFGRLKKAQGFGRQHVFHSIRKTVATLLDNAGVPENVAADILGHEKPTMTYGLYSGGSTLETKRRALKKISYPA